MNPLQLPSTPRPASQRRAMLRLFATVATLGGAGLLWQGIAHSGAEEPVVIAPPAMDMPTGAARLERAIFAGGCFWGVQGVYQHVEGVTAAVSGYSGGTAATARYDAVARGRTRHAESVEVTYDPAQVSYGALLQIFFSVVHDPTQLDRQGPDVGPQYRSAIFPTSQAQREVADAYIAQLDASGVFGRPIVTRVEATPSFFPAEDYHQDYMIENPRQPYIVVNDLPKVANLRKMFPQRYRAEPVLVKQAPSGAPVPGSRSRP